MESTDRHKNGHLRKSNDTIHNNLTHAGSYRFVKKHTKITTIVVQKANVRLSVADPRIARWGLPTPEGVAQTYFCRTQHENE